MKEIKNQNMKTTARIERFHPSMFRDILKAAAAVNEEHDIILDPEGLRVTTMSPDHVCMVDLYLSRGFFDRFDVIEEYKAAANMKDIVKLVFNRKTGKLKDSSLDIHLEGYKATFRGSGSLSGVKTYPLFEPLEDEVPIPKLVYTSSIRLLAETFKKVFDDCTVHENVFVKVEDDNLVFKCAYEKYYEENAFDRYSDEILDFYTEQKTTAWYEVEYLNQFARALKKISEVVTFEFNTDLPMKISADLPAESRIIYYIAPKVGSPDQTQEPQDAEVPEVVDHIEEIPQVEEVPDEIPEVEVVTTEVPEVVIEVPQVARATKNIPSWLLREAQLRFFADNPERYSRPTPEEIQPYLEVVH